MSDSLPVPQTPPASPTAPSNAKGNSAVPSAPDGEAPESGDITAFDGLLDAALAAPEDPMRDLPSFMEAANPLAALPQPGKDLPLDDALPMNWNGLFLISEPPTNPSAKATGDEPALVLAAVEGQGADERGQMRMQMFAAGAHLRQVGESGATADPTAVARIEKLMNQTTLPTADAEPAHPNGRTELAGVSFLAPAQASGGERLRPQPGAITVPPQHPQWSQALGERLHWMVSQQLQSAEIRLDPPELGSLDVKVVVNKDHATVHFVTHNPQVRDALETATPRLREMFADAGLNLGDVNVSQESFQQQAAHDEAARQGASGAVDSSEEDAVIAPVGGPSVHPRRGQGLLDTYV